MKIQKFWVQYTLAANALICAIAVLLLPSTALALSPVCTWTGADGSGNWSASGNWSCTSGLLPVNGDSLVFPDNLAPFSTTAITDDISNLSLDTITFTGSSNMGGFTIGGSTTLNLSGGIYNNATGTPLNSINVGVTLTGDVTFSGDKQLTFSGGPVTIGTHTLNLTGTGGFMFNTPIVGPGMVHENTSNTNAFLWWNSPNFTGQLIVSNSVVIESQYPDALGSSSIVVNNGGSLTFQANASGTYTFSNALQLGGTGNAGNVTGQLNLADGTGGQPITVNFTGPVALSANAQVSASVTNTNFNGPTTGCFSIIKQTGSTGTLSGNLTGTCTPPPSGSSSNNLVSTPKAPDTGYGRPTGSGTELQLLLISGTFLAVGATMLYFRRSD